MRHFSFNNPQATAYQQIFEHLWSAASQCKCLRDESKSSSRSQIVRTVFGNASPQVEGQRPASIQPKPLSNSNRRSSMPAPAVYDQTLLDEIDLLPLNQFDTLLQSLMTTTSGGLMPVNNDSHNYHDLVSDEPTNTLLSGYSPLSTHSPPSWTKGLSFRLIATCMRGTKRLAELEYNSPRGLADSPEGNDAPGLCRSRPRRLLMMIRRRQLSIMAASMRPSYYFSTPKTKPSRSLCFRAPTL
jgi:hypothetical protein